MRSPRQLIADRSGGAAVEFGLIAPILIAVVLGVAATAGTIRDYHAMRRAVSSGAQLLMATDVDIEAVREVTLNSWPDKAEGSTVQVSQWCRCGVTQHACTTNCDDGDYPEMFTQIDAATLHTGPLGSQTLTTSQKVRTR
jgi:Flp pilus assembly protein TadG